ncbi:MAG: hypothetical protein GY811_24320 [Myxococcales bacterium]|nr:hypothetical protein [Myxococcales bacterium]
MFAQALCLVAPAMGLACGGSQAGTGETEAAMQSPEWSEEKSVQTEPEVEELARAAQCSGAALNTQLLARSGMCDIEGHSRPLPPSVSARLASPSVTAISGQVADVEIVLSNSGTSTADLYLDHSCGFESLSSMVLRDDASNRLDRVGRDDCPLDASCVGQVAHLSLPPGGEAIITLPLPASVSVVGDQCEEMPGRALSPGTYSVAWKTPYSETPLVTTLKVLELRRLSKSECKTYSKAVAAKAEPDIRLRRSVERQLLFACQAEQPSQKFADCRMKAITELELANCQEVKLPR